MTPLNAEVQSIVTENEATYSSFNRLLSFIEQLLNKLAIFRTRQQHIVTKPQEICAKKDIYGETYI